ncbi:ribonuclease H-like domain-containing protein [Tanacetum coccineum]
METQKPLLKDGDGEEVDVYMYRSMIGSLMYLKSSRPDIMFSICACARYQVNPKISHLYAVKRIFRYLKGQPKLGHWYLKDSPFDLVAYTDSDYARASLDRKSTSGEKAKKSVRLMMEKLVIRENRQRVLVKTVNGEVQLQALVDGKKIIITESTVRRDLQLEDAEGVDCLPNSTIFEQLTLMGKPKRKDTQIPQSSGPTKHVADETVYKELDDSLVRAATTASSLEAVGNKRILNCYYRWFKLQLLVVVTAAAQDQRKLSAQMVAAAKLPVLNPGDFKLWKMRIEQYFLMTDYALWEVIVNGDSPLPKKTVDGVEQTYPPTTAEEKLARKNELKAREGLDQIYDRLQKLISQLEIHGEIISQEDVNLKLLRSLPYEWKTHNLIWRNKSDLDTMSMDDLYNNLKSYKTEVKGSSSTIQNTQNVAFVSSNIIGSTNEAVKTAHGVSATDSKTNASTLPNVDSLSDAVIYSIFARDGLIVADGNADNEGNEISQEDMKESRAPKYQDNKNRETTRRTVPVVETISNALVSQCDGLGSSSSSSLDSESQINVRAYKPGLESVEARLDMYKNNEVVFEENIKILKLDIMLRDNALTEHRKKFKKAEKERDDLKLTLEKFENSSKNLSKLLDIQVSDKFKIGVGFNSQVFDSQVNDKYKIGEGYHAVPPPYIENFMPPKPDLVLADGEEYVFSKSITRVPAVATSELKTSESKPKSVNKPLIEDWISDSEDENETQSKSKQRKPSFAKVEFLKYNEHVKSPRESVKKVENNEQAKYPRKNSQSSKGNMKNWNNLMTQKLGSNFEFKNKACYICGSFNHLIKDCDFHKKKMVEKPVWNNARRVNHQNSQRMTDPHPKGNFVPKAVLMKSDLKTLNTARQNFSQAAISVNTTRPINTAFPKPTVNCARPVLNVFNKAHSHVRRPFNKFTTNKNSIYNKKVNTVKENVTTAGPKIVVSNNKGNEANAVKASIAEYGVSNSTEYGVSSSLSNTVYSSQQINTAYPLPLDMSYFLVKITKVIKGEFEKIKDIKVEDVSLTCDTPLEIFNIEVGRLSRMDNDLFIYEVEVANIPCNSKMDDDSEDEADDDIGYDPSDVTFIECLGLKIFNYKTMDQYTMKALWIYCTREDDEVELTDEESSDNEDEIAEVFRIDTNIFDYETPICLAFNEFNYLINVDPDLLTKDIIGFKTYEDYKDDWIYEWNKDIPWVDEKPWTDTGVWTEPKPVIHTCKPFNYKTGCLEWPTYYEWYKALEDSELKDEALRNKAIMEGFIDENDDKFEMIKYSFGQDEEYVAIKEDENDDLERTSNDACRPREINIDEYWWRIYESGNLEVLES